MESEPLIEWKDMCAMYVIGDLYNQPTTGGLIEIVDIIVHVSRRALV